MRNMILAAFLAGFLGTGPMAGTARASTCNKELDALQVQLMQVSDMARKTAVQAVIDEGRRAAALGQFARCEADVEKAKKALSR